MWPSLNFRNLSSFPSTHLKTITKKLEFSSVPLWNTLLLPQYPKPYWLGIRKTPRVLCNTSLCISAENKSCVYLYENTWKIISILVQVWAASHPPTSRRRKPKAESEMLWRFGIPGAREDTVVTQLLFQHLKSRWIKTFLYHTQVTRTWDRHKTSSNFHFGTLHARPAHD